MNTFLNAKVNATRIILNEHRNLAAVIQEMEGWVRMVDDGKAPLHPEMFRGMLRYLDDYPERLHHPKEDRYLFARLHMRDTGLDCVLAELEFQHAKGAGLVRGMEYALNRFELEGKSVFPLFRDLVFQYADFCYAHMSLEEEVVLPAAARFLTDDDWHVVITAFSAYDDALSSVAIKGELDELFSQIINFKLTSIELGPALE